MHRHVENYLQSCLAMMQSSLHEEMNYLQRKDENFFDTPTLIEIIHAQQQSYQRGLARHAKYFLEHRDWILEEVQGIPAHKDDVLMHFLTSHDKQFKKLLKKQILRTKPSNRIMNFFRRKTHQDLDGLLGTEETLFSEYLDLFHTKAQDLDAASDYLASCERFDTIERYSLLSAAGITAAPIGPLEFLSLPFWGTYFSLHAIEEHKKSFAHWRRIKKPRIIHEHAKS